VGDRHLAHELEHRGTSRVQREQVATLARRRLPPGERVALAAVLGEQRRRVGARRAPTGPATRRHHRDRQQRCECANDSHPAKRTAGHAPVGRSVAGEGLCVVGGTPVGERVVVLAVSLLASPG
jgi:hypothetical protein